MAYDLTGRQQIVLRGGAGLFFDRPERQLDLLAGPESAGLQERHRPHTAQLQTLGSGGLTTDGAAGARRLRVRQQAAVVRAVERRRADDAAVVDGARRRVRRPAQLQHRSQGVNINAVDFGAAFLPQNQDRDARREPDARRDAPCRRTRCGRSAATARSRSSGAAAGGRTTRSSSRSSAGSATASRSASTTRSALDDRQHRGAAAAQPGRLVLAPRRSGRGGRAARHDDRPPRTSMKAQLRLGSARPHASGSGAARARRCVVNDWQLSGIWTGRDGQPVHRRLQLPERRRQREPDRLAGLRRARPRRRRSRARLQQRPLPAVQHRRVPGTAQQQRRPRVGQRLPARLLHAACSICRSPATSGSAAARQHPAARRHVQRAEQRRSSPAATRR